MASFNEFRLIGSCYSDAHKISIAKDRYKTTFTIAVDSVAQKKKHFIPVVAPSYLAEKAFQFCRNGNLIAVIGELMTNEVTDRSTGFININVYFVATDIALIEKVERTALRDKLFVDDVNKMPIEEEET